MSLVENKVKLFRILKYEKNQFIKSFLCYPEAWMNPALKA